VATGLCRQETEAEEEMANDRNEETKSRSSFHVVNTRGLDHTANHLMCLHR
jgi:hypothetical protein